MFIFNILIGTEDSKLIGTSAEEGYKDEKGKTIKQFLKSKNEKRNNNHFISPPPHFFSFFSYSNSYSDCPKTKSIFVATNIYSNHYEKKSNRLSTRKWT